VAATFVPAVMVPLAGNATVTEAPLGSVGSRTERLLAPGAGAGIATALLSENDCGNDPLGA